MKFLVVVTPPYIYQKVSRNTTPKKGSHLRSCASAMDSASTGPPLGDSLVALAASNRTGIELRKLLIRMDYGSAAATAQATESGEEDEFWEAAVAEEDGAMLVVTTTVPPDVSIRPT